jgi:hypothetical protein
MSIDTIINGVSTVGFPAVAYMLMYRFAKETIKENTAAIRELQTEVANLNE